MLGERCARTRCKASPAGQTGDRLVRGLRTFFIQQGLKADWEAIEKAPIEHLVTSISMLCPFPPSEKQALLEAADLEELAKLLTTLLEMAAVKPPTEEDGGTRH